MFNDFKDFTLTGEIIMHIKHKYVVRVLFYFSENSKRRSKCNMYMK